MLDIARIKAEDPVGPFGIIELEAESPDEEPYQPVHVSTGDTRPGTSTPMKKWKIMGSRRFVEIFGIEAIWRLGVYDLLFED